MWGGKYTSTLLKQNVRKETPGQENGTNSHTNQAAYNSSVHCLWCVRSHCLNQEPGPNSIARGTARVINKIPDQDETEFKT